MSNSLTLCLRKFGFLKYKKKTVPPIVMNKCPNISQPEGWGHTMSVCDQVVNFLELPITSYLMVGKFSAGYRKSCSSASSNNPPCFTLCFHSLRRHYKAAAMSLALFLEIWHREKWHLGLHHNQCSYLAYNLHFNLWGHVPSNRWKNWICDFMCYAQFYHMYFINRLSFIYNVFWMFNTTVRTLS